LSNKSNKLLAEPGRCAESNSVIQSTDHQIAETRAFKNLLHSNMKII